MAKGASAGLLDEQRSQSVFKHKILNTYIVPFCDYDRIAGGRSPGSDPGCFAGRGRYPNGEPASGELFLQALLKAPAVNIESVLIEKNRSDFTKLAALVDEYRDQGVRAVALFGEVLDHLLMVVQQATGAPLFMFLDPCGAGVPYADLVKVLSGPCREVRPATEVLLNFSADLTRRTADVLNADRERR